MFLRSGLRQGLIAFSSRGTGRAVNSVTVDGVTDTATVHCSRDMGHCSAVGYVTNRGTDLTPSSHP